MERTFLDIPDLIGFLAEYQPDRLLTGLERLTGGTKKGVYRLTFGDGGTLVMYVWSSAENYWPASEDPSGDPFTDANGPDLFAANHAALNAAGMRTPALLAFDRGRRHLEADLALLEDVRGGSLEALIERDPAAAAAPLAKLGAGIRAMHAYRGERYGKLAVIERGDAPQDRAPEDAVVARALRHLAGAAARDGRIAGVRDRVEQHVRILRAAVQPRHEYGLVHGELGPDHVFLAEGDEPVMIDIEGLTFFDVEWEHAFLRLRFGAHYLELGLPPVDEARVALYRFAQSLSLIEGPLRLADTDFPNRDFMLWIAEGQINQVLADVATAGT